MQNLDFSKLRRFHLVGVCGAGMGALAKLLVDAGKDVSGSDIKPPTAYVLPVLDRIRFTQGHNPKNVAGADVVVASSAVSPENPELVEARRRGIPVLHRVDALVALLRSSGLRQVVVCGSHGKSTTAAMLYWILKRCGKGPWLYLGAILEGIPSEIGRGDVAVVEGDESDGSFLKFDPHIAVVTSVEDDHLEFYGSRERLISAFAEFVAKAKVPVVFGESEGSAEAVKKSGRKAVVVGFSEGDYRVEIRRESGGCYRIRVEWGDKIEAKVGVPGRHNAINASLAAAAAVELGVPKEGIKDGIESFPGIARRLELVWGGTPRVYDDYAHHPTKVLATLEALEEMGFKRIVAVFQPHRFTRFCRMWERFADALAHASAVVVLPVYPAGEKRPQETHYSEFLKKMRGVFGEDRVRVAQTLDEATSEAVSISEEIGADVVVTLGAGDVTEVARKLARVFGRERG